MAAVFGFNCKMYRNTASYGTPTWDLVDQVNNVEVAINPEKVEASVRGSGGWKQYLSGEKDASIKFDMKHDTANTDYTTIATASRAGTTLDLLFLDGLVATTGSQGLRAICYIFDNTISQERSQPSNVSFEAAPALEVTNVPSWYTAA